MTVVIHEHDPGWALAFVHERVRLLGALGEGVVAVEHIGSTAVPGLAAKPVIDILIVVAHAALDTTQIEAMRAAGYRYHGAAGVRGRAFFSRFDQVGYHVQAYAEGDPEISWMLDFRDRLRGDAALVDEYASIKRGLASRHGDDRDTYTSAKRAFVRRHSGRPVTELRGMTLVTDRLIELSRFYQRVLGTHAESETADVVRLRLGDVVIVIERRTSCARGGAPSDDAVAFKVHDIDDWCLWLRASGIDVVGPSDGPRGRVAHVRDPDGRMVELS